MFKQKRTVAETPLVQLLSLVHDEIDRSSSVERGPDSHL